MSTKTKYDSIIHSENLKSSEEVREEVKKIIESVLPNTFNVIVQSRKSFDGSQYLAIGASPSFYEISRVKGQFPQFVSLRLDLETIELEAQRYFCMGGNHFYRQVRPDLFPKEKYHALGSVKVPFRKPKKEWDAVYRAIKRFFEKYISLLIEWKDDLTYTEEGDYSFLSNN